MTGIQYPQIGPPGRYHPAQRRGRRSGKTYIAEQLLLVLDEPWFHLPVDAINSMRARQRTLELSPAELELVLARTRTGFHRAVAGMAAADNAVADHVLSERWRLLDCLAVLEDFDVVFVGVRCAKEALKRRTRLRGDRDVDTILAQHEWVHAHGRYDLECDTTHASPLECALSIKAFLARDPHPPRAFDGLRAKAAAEGGRPAGSRPRTRPPSPPA